jgi:hypothetical protein
MDKHRRKETRKLVFRLAFALAVLLVLTALFEILRVGLVGYRETGTADRAVDIPTIGAFFEGFDSEGPVEYTEAFSARGGSNFQICGVTSEAEAREFCERLGLTPGYADLASANARLQYGAKATRREGRFWKGPFDEADYVVEDRNPELGQVLVAWRRLDGWFSIKIGTHTRCPKPAWKTEE